jgi:phosphoglucosamine mutase
MSLAGLRIVVDCAHGATYQVAPRVFAELGADVVVIGAAPNGFNINDGVGSTHPETLQAAVQESNADLGVAFDGDGDRVVMVDADGVIRDGDELLYVIAAGRIDQGYQGGVVGTLMSNLGLEQAIEALGRPFQRAKVGDRYVHEALRREQWLLGGESSGHLLCLDCHTTGDGIIAALQVLAEMTRKERSLAELLEPMSILPQVLINVRIEQPVSLEDAVIADAVAAAERELAERGRVLLRPSGTEPLIRVMVEGQSETQVKAVAETLADAVRRHAAA